MNPHRLQCRQLGATLIIGLIMLALITLTVTTAFTLSGTNLKSVGNMQFRNEALAAANKAIEQVLGSPFYTAPTAEEINVDINNDDNVDYVVQISAPACIRASAVAIASGAGGQCSITISEDCATTTSDYWTTWNIQGTVTDTISGTSIVVHQGIRKKLTQTQCDQVCAPAPSVPCS